MYKEFYSLVNNPFDLVPNPDILFMSEMHQEALAMLGYGVITQKGFLVLTGDVGTGKTTLLHEMVRSLKGKSNICLLSNPALSRSEFFGYLAHRFGLKYDGDKSGFLFDFSGYLEQCAKKEERVLILIDEAHVLPIEILEEVRLLSNQGLSCQHILSIFLIGQPELNQLLGDERLSPLRQRIGIRYHLNPFNREETRRYIVFRLKKSGALDPNLFSDGAIDRVYLASKGIPRLINVICDNALLAGYSDSKKIIDAEVIDECVADLQFRKRERGTGFVFRDLKEKRKWALSWVLVLSALIIVIIWFREIVPERWQQYLLGLTGGMGEWFWRLVWENFLRQ